jgi:hypothetical protein
MPASAVVQKHEERISFLPTERLEALGPWTQPQQRLLEVLQHEEHRYASIAKICQDGSNDYLRLSSIQRIAPYLEQRFADERDTKILAPGKEPSKTRVLWQNWKHWAYPLENTIFPPSCRRTCH